MEVGERGPFPSRQTSRSPISSLSISIQNPSFIPYLPTSLPNHHPEAFLLCPPPPSPLLPSPFPSLCCLKHVTRSIHTLTNQVGKMHKTVTAMKDHYNQTERPLCFQLVLIILLKLLKKNRSGLED